MSEYYSDFAREVFQQINKVRKFPRTFIPFLEDRLDSFDGKVWLCNADGGIVTEEGPQAVKEAIDALKSCKPASDLEWSEPLKNACRDHVNDIGAKGLLSHQGSDKSSYNDRIERYCQWGGSIFEAIDYGEQESAREVVLSMLIDDGVPKRIKKKIDAVQGDALIFCPVREHE